MIRDNLKFIQAIRGIAALSVVLFHSSRFLSPYGTGLGNTIFGPMGYMGVSAFFMISGLIMVISTTTSDGTIKYAIAFIIKRICRIWPVYAITTIIYLIFRGGISSFTEEEHIPLLLKSLFFVPISNTPAPVFGFPSLVVGWTLNYEVLFYLLFGVSIIFGKRRWLSLMITSILLLIVIPEVNSDFSIDPKVNYGFSSPLISIATSPMMWLFFVGVILGLIYKSNLKLKSKKIGLPLLIISFLSVIFQYALKYRIGHGIADFGLTLFPFLLICVLYFKSFSDFTPSFLVSLGNISFSLYLWHPAVQETLPKLEKLIGATHILSGFTAIFITTLISILVATASKFILEDMLSNRIRNAILGHFMNCDVKPSTENKIL